MKIQTQSILTPTCAVLHQGLKMKAILFVPLILTITSANAGYLNGGHFLPATNVVSSRTIVGGAVGGGPTSGAVSTAQYSQTVSAPATVHTVITSHPGTNIGYPSPSGGSPGGGSGGGSGGGQGGSGGGSGSPGGYGSHGSYVYNSGPGGNAQGSGGGSRSGGYGGQGGSYGGQGGSSGGGSNSGYGQPQTSYYNHQRYY